MDFNKFAQDRTDCHASENGFLLWRLTDGGSFMPGLFDDGGENIVVHILVCGGELRVTHGNVCYTLAAGTFSSFIDRPQFRVLSASSGVVAYVMVFKHEYLYALTRNHPPVPFSYVLERRENPVDELDAESLTRLRRRTESVREACMDVGNPFRDKMIKCALWMLLMEVAGRYINSGGEEDPAAGSDRAMRLFTGFMHLLPESTPAEHFAGYYAERLCVTPQYLNRVVKSLSGRTVSGWINFTLVGEITRRLENTNETMQQIATALNFPDQATLTKFFKRETGYSLTEYKRKSRG